MKVNKSIANFMFRRIKKVLKNMYGKHTMILVKKARGINKELLAKMDDITNKNPMAPRIQISFPIIAVWLASDKNIKPDSMGEVMYKALDTFKVHMHCGKIDLNKDKDLAKYNSRNKKIEKWASKHPKESNSWQFVFDDDLHQEGAYHGVTYCPIAAFCKKYGYEDIAPVLCKIDYLIVQLYHGVLLRNKTIAAGDDMCDCWVVGDKKLMFIKW